MSKFFRVDSAASADLKVFVTDIRSEADLVIFETTDAWAATESQIWCYTDIQSEANKTVYFTDSAGEADLSVFKTDVQSDAEWRNADKAWLLA